MNDGSAIAVKTNSQHNLIDDFDTHFLAIEIHTTQGPMVTATTYLPPRRPYLPYPDMYRLLNSNIPTLVLGDFNSSHTRLGNRTNNIVAKSIINLKEQGNLIHLGSQFPTYISHNTATNPDKVFSNKHNYLSTLIELGDITTSDHIPVILTVSTTPIYIKAKESFQYTKGNWEKFKGILNDKLTVKNLDNCTTYDFDQKFTNWINTFKHAMDESIPKCTHKPKYQIITTPVRELERDYNILRNTATTHGWAHITYREHTRIRHELRELCKEAYKSNWEKNINNIIQISKDTKTFWNKIKLLRGNTNTHTNYLIDKEGNKQHTENRNAK